MTLEEAIEMANRGDVTAMAALGDYYSQQKDGSGIVSAEEWYGKAVRAGADTVLYRYILIKQITAHVTRMITGSFVEAIDDYEELVMWEKRFSELKRRGADGTEKVSVEEIESLLNEGQYKLALGYYGKDNYSKAMDIVKGIRTKESVILRTVCDVHIKNPKGPQFRTICGDLSFLGHDEEYGSKEKDDYEEMLYMIGGMAFSQSISSMMNASSSEVRYAYESLLFVRNHLRNEGFHEIVDEELAKYHKTLIGYRYDG